MFIEKRLFDYSSLFNAVAAQDAKGVIRALRPILSMYEHTDFAVTSREDYPERDKDVTKVKELGEVITATVGALDGSIRKSVIDTICANEASIHLSPQFYDLIDDEDPETPIELVSDDRFREELESFSDSDAHMGPEAAARYGDELMADIAKNIDRSERYDAYMAVAYATTNGETIEKALESAVSNVEEIPPVGDASTADMAYHAALEIHGLADEPSDVEEVAKALIEDCSKDRKMGYMDRANFLKHVGKLSPA